MRRITLWISLLASLTVNALAAGLHDGQQVFAVSDEPKSQQSSSGFLTKFELDGPEHAEALMQVAQANNFDLWHITPNSADLFLPSTLPLASSTLANFTALSTVPVSLPIPPQIHIAEFVPDVANLTNSTFHHTYHPLAEADAFVRALAERHADIASLVRIGFSAEGRELVALRVSNASAPGSRDRKRERREMMVDVVDEDGWVVVDADGMMEAMEVDDVEVVKELKKNKKSRRKSKKSKSKKNKKGKKSKKNKPSHLPKIPTTAGSKPAIVVFGPQHAREWVGAAGTLYLAHALVAERSEKGSLRALLDSFDFYIVPTPNPDGYAYTWEVDRLWYKNRQKTGPSDKCVGIDLNRNWGYKWRRSDANAPFTGSASTPTSDACAHWYPGRRAFEAPEANALAGLLHVIPEVAAFVEMRAYGQIVSAPYSYSCKVFPKDAEDQFELALGAARAMLKSHGSTFSTGQLCSTLYRAHGNAVDYAYKRAGIKFSYAVHLRDTGTYGFALPVDMIRPAGEEAAEMIAYLAQFAKTRQLEN